ncbi:MULTISPECIES: MFS transporter [Candidatus Ichthyocystis]|uniref:Putative transporter MFS superfamily n=1 Tax=Candidatus Ichthyocystis hellenicum TaxID=1561003 RepID=A0A0S4LZS1_9BURK|nr:MULTISPECIES: MFS transporter [Ichthyocystis]CUT16990.1 putative transporter MFS superfamily [Candidatus Ichthyocystis hellenicum]
MSFSALEKKSLFFISLLYVFRLSGNFLILPLFEPYSRSLSGESNALLIGLALGIFGFGQAVMQLPLGWLSDRVGRKIIIISCLSIFSVATYGCFIAKSIGELALARLLQGLCAYSSVLSALMADYTQPKNLTKASALIGVIIGITFISSFSASPLIARHTGIKNIFLIIIFLSFLSLIVTTLFLPPEPPIKDISQKPSFKLSVAIFHKTPCLWLITFSFMTLHAVLSACWMVFPTTLSGLGYSLGQQGKVYGSVMISSFVVMVALVLLAEKAKSKRLTIVSGFTLMFIGQSTLFFAVHKKLLFIIAMTVFFSGFNLLEAYLPATMARLAPKKIRGTAMGISSTAQFMGIFMGGLLSGIIIRYLPNRKTIFFINALVCLVFSWVIWLQWNTYSKQTEEKNRGFNE